MKLRFAQTKFAEGVQLLARCQAGDGLAVEQLVSDYQGRLFRLAVSILDDGSPNGWAEAEEVTQDALLSALRKSASYRGEASLSTWLYTITVNLCRNRLRSRQRRQKMQQLFQIVDQDESQSPVPEDTVIQNEANDGLLNAVQSLDEKHRLPTILRYYHECSINEIAQILEIPVGTVHSRLNKARQRLREYLEVRKAYDENHP